MPRSHVRSSNGSRLAALIGLRARLLRSRDRHPSRSAAEAGIADCLRAYFEANPPQLRRIDRDTPAAVLDQIVRYEAVHAIRDRRDLMRRLEADRRCYALFSPALPNEPLAFTEIAFTQGISRDVSALLDTDSLVVDVESCDSAMFYSISSCQDGLRGVPFGNTLIRRVVDRVREELPFIRTFATVSPVPGFRMWLNALARSTSDGLDEVVAKLDDARWPHQPDESARLKLKLLPLCASYLLHAKRGSEPLDAVARFHLGNGARLERINWLGDRTDAGFARSAGIAANYLYDLSHVDANRDAYRSGSAMIVAPEVNLLVASHA